MTAASLVPAQLKAAGYDPKEIYTYLLKEALNK